MQDERVDDEKHVVHGDVEQQIGDGRQKMQSIEMAGQKDAKIRGCAAVRGQESAAAPA